MCGIVGHVGERQAAPILLDGLRRLEYRGYDSAGVAIHCEGEIRVLRAVGKLANLERAFREQPIGGQVGVGHTRWATHGRPSELNAHPHVAGPVVVVHNGIIENHLELRHDLERQGYRVVSDTDTEIIAHLVHRETDGGADLEAAVRRALAHVQGAYAIAVMSAKEPDRIIVAKNASPLVLGLGEDAMYCASDVPALLPYTNTVIFLEDGEMAVLKADGVAITTIEGEDIERAPTRITWSPMMAEKSGYRHFMLKEIHEQPRAIEDTLRGRLDREHADIHGRELGLDEGDASSIERILLLACGTSHHATIAGRYWLEELTGLPTVVELASEFRGRNAVVGDGDLVIAVSQSGETIDTLIAAREAKHKGAKVLAIANVNSSAIPRMADAAFYTHAGPEIGVASTKCFTAQLAALFMLSVWLGKRRGVLTNERAATLIEGLARIPHLMTEVLDQSAASIEAIARKHAEARDVLFLGRGLSYAIALEGALKLKEISYVHAEGYAAGEMKHGPIALIDPHVPVIVIAPKDAQYERTLSNLQEARARDAQIIAVLTEGDTHAAPLCEDVIELPVVHETLTPFLTVLPLQLYAYYVADHKGTDIDQPRNLAKTVTVE